MKNLQAELAVGLLNGSGWKIVLNIRAIQIQFGARCVQLSHRLPHLILCIAKPASHCFSRPQFQFLLLICIIPLSCGVESSDCKFYLHSRTRTRTYRLERERERENGLVQLVGSRKKLIYFASRNSMPRGTYCRL